MEPVRVHFNLRTHLWSITAMSGPNRGRVVQHSNTFVLTVCKFIVSEAGRQRVLAKRQRLVHAWVQGRVAPVSNPPKDAVEFGYNPYRAGTFTRRDNGQPITSATFCWFVGRSAFALER
jgi:hypothetical protein